MKKPLALLIVLFLVLAACGSDKAGSPGDFVPPEVQYDSEPVLKKILATIPDTQLSREHLLIDDLAARRAFLQLPVPGPDASPGEINEYAGDLLRSSADEHLSLLTPEYGEVLVGLGHHGEPPEEFGYDFRNVHQSVIYRGGNGRYVELAFGDFSPDTIDSYIAECDNCVPVETLVHQETSYYAWAVGVRDGDIRRAPPLTTSTGEGGHFRFTDETITRTLHRVDMENLIEVVATGSPSLLEDEDFALAASLLGRMNGVDASFSGSTLSLGRSLDDFGRMIEYQGEHFETVDDVEATLRGPGLLRPYSLHASTISFAGDDFIVTNILVHADESTAAANVPLLEERMKNGRNLRDEKWTDYFDSFNVRSEGRAVIAQFKSSDSSVRLLRVTPTDTEWSLVPFYSTMFVHEDYPGQPEPLHLAFPTPTPTATPSAESAEGVVGEQEPACLNRGGGGHYRDGFNRVYWFMDLPEPGISDAQAVAQHICLRGGSWVPDGNIIVKQADFLLRDLKEWRSDPIFYSLETVYSVRVDERLNRITTRVRTPYAEEQLRAAINASGIPPEAVIVELDESFGPDNPPVMPASVTGIELLVRYPTEVPLGDEIEFEIVLKNTADRTIEVEHGHPADVNILILSADGTQIWRRLGPGWGVGGSTKLRFRQEVSFTVKWSQFDLDGFAVPAGDYLVRAFASFITYDNGSRGNAHALSTAPQAIRIVE